MADGYSKNVKVSRAIARIHTGLIALTFAIIGGSGLFIMTGWLILKGQKNAGQHLQLLGQYFIGYTVTWEGSIVGFFYGAVLGGIVGWLIGWIYNRLVNLRS